MDGWGEDEFANKDLMAPCGLYCGTCGIYLANRDNNEKFRAVMGNLYGHPARRNNLRRLHAAGPAKKSLYLLPDVRHQGLCQIKRVLLLPPMCGLALRALLKILAWPRGNGSCCAPSPHGVRRWRNWVMRKAALNGQDMNANGITVPPAVIRFSGGFSAAGNAKKMWRMRWTALYDHCLKGKRMNKPIDPKKFGLHFSTKIKQQDDTPLYHPHGPQKPDHHERRR